MRMMANILIYSLLASCVSMPDIGMEKIRYLSQVQGKAKMDVSHGQIFSLVNECAITISETLENNFENLNIENVDFSKPHILFVSASSKGYISNYIAFLGSASSGQIIADSTESEKIRYLQKRDFKKLLNRLDNIDEYKAYLYRPDILHSSCYFISVYKNNDYKTIITSSEMMRSEYLKPDSGPVTIMIYFLSDIKI